ncbi:MAG: sugar transferase [Candidatus Vogelbacteria bacterium]|nr:sugar transferase [Candidatus Vogelbacteria bacterium]
MIGQRVRREALVLFLGDLIFFVLALWLTLAARFLVWPSPALILAHLGPFSIIFLLWTLVFFIADLYNRRFSFQRERLANTVINLQLVNSFLAVLFFYFIPYFVITPKTTLFVDLFFSLFLILWWRLSLSNFLYRGRSEKYLFLCHGAEVDELKQALANAKNDRYHITVMDKILPPAEWRRQKIAVVVLNPYDQRRTVLAADFYQVMFAGIRLMNIHELYEDIFGRIPISVIDERWLAEHTEFDDWSVYRLAKRWLDVMLAAAFFILSLPLYPLVALAIKLEDGGPIFYVEDRVGQFGRIFKIRKFRSMTIETRLEARRVTRIGGWLRRTRLDELPQLLSVIAGVQSLIGPRPERPEYAKMYEREIPYYHARHLIPPGLSGWAQIYQERHPHFAPQADATREKLSYDLYYVKNRSFWLDLKIVLKTIRTLLSRSGL